MVIINWSLMLKLLVYPVICIKSFFTDDIVFVGCALPSCLKSSNLVVPLYCSLNMLEGDTGYALYFMPFLEFFISEEHSDYRCILEIIYVSMFMESDLDL